MILLLATTFIIVAALTIRYFARVDGVLSPPVVFAFSIGVYVFAIPVEMVLRNRFQILTTRGWFDVSPTTVVTIELLGLVALATVTIVYRLLYRTKESLDPLIDSEHGKALDRSTASVLFAVSFVFLIAVVTLYPNNILAARDYVQNVGQVYDQSGYGLLARYASVSYAMALFLIVRHVSTFRFLQAIVFASPLLAWGVYSNDKDPLVFAAVGLSPLLLTWVRRSSLPRFVVTLGAIVIGTGLASVVFSLNRGGSHDFSSHIADSGIFLGTEPAGPMFVTVESIVSPTTLQFGSSIVQATYLWIPKAIWPYRPDDLATEFAKMNMPNWSPGQGYGFSPLAEGYMNGGLVGTIAVFAVIAAIFVLLQRLLQPRLRSVEELNPLGSAMLNVPVAFAAFTCFRGSLSTIVTGISHFTFLYFLVAAILMIQHRRRERILVSATKHGGMR